MNKKLFVLALASAFMCGGLLGCDDDSDEVSSCDKDCSQIVGGRVHSCFLISGKEECKPACMGDKEGQNAPACWTHSSIPEPNQKSVVDFCVKDDKGNLYADLDQSSDTLCSAGCDSATGVCKLQVVGDCDKDCSGIVGGREHICVKISDQKDCKPKCLGNKEGLNDPVCWKNPSVPNATESTVKDFCIKDDLGILYADVNQSLIADCIGCSEGADCSGGGDKSCSQAKIDECDSFAGGRIKKCFVISGVEECMPPCMGDKEGLNDPVCYTQAAIATPVDYSLKDFCVKDDSGKLFADVTKTESSTCSAGCDESTGICKLSPVE